VSQRLERVTTEALRVALVAVAIVAGAYAVISVVVVMYVSNSLTSQVDSRLVSSLTRIANNPFTPIRVTPGSSRDPLGNPLGAPLHIWVVLSDGRVASPDTTVSLPSGAMRVSNPTTVNINGDDVRVAGTTISGDHVVLGQSLDGVAQARGTTIAAELIVGTVLLVLVFLGALWVGRRVGAPFELARQRQLEFTADASHELRTPLSVIEAQTSLALNQERDPRWYHSAFERVGSETKRMRHLVDDLLWLARVDTTEVKPESEPVDLGVLARRAVDRFASVCEARDVNLSLTIAEGEHTLTGSAPWLDRLVGVLLDNACKYAPPGGHVAVTVSSGQGRVQLSVDDSGPGIPTEERPRIFDRFHRATDQAGGSGLGLAIGDTVVRKTGGRWEVRTSPLGGAGMTVSWPRAGA
jgi:two-component system, OmpR family, sensor histidine kinase CiaH